MLVEEPTKEELEENSRKMTEEKIVIKCGL
jgi:hypothetical protein